MNALNAFYETLGQPPQSLTKKAAQGLAGELYWQAVSEIDDDDYPMP